MPLINKSPMKHAFLFPLLLANLLAGTAPIDEESLEAGEIPPAGSGDFLNSLFTGEQRLDLNHEFLHHDDIAVNRSSLIYRQSRENWSLEANLGFTDIGIDYTDAVGLTRASRRTEESWSGGLTLSLDLNDSLSTTFGFTAYEGYADYQSVCASESR